MCLPPQKGQSHSFLNLAGIYLQWEAEETPALPPTPHLRVPACPPGRGSWPSRCFCASHSQENRVVSMVLKAEVPGAPQAAGSG